MMTKKYKVTKMKCTVVLVTAHFLFIQAVSGQKPVNITDFLSQRFSRYVSSVPREEVFIHSDRNDYISGEDFWFKVYLIDRQSFRPSLRSRIVYFELLNNENRPIIQKRILIENGSGPGKIVLPDTLTTGTYRIRAYSNWMKNFLPENCFLDEIRVYNPLSTKTLQGAQIKNTGLRKNTSDGIPGQSDKQEVSLRINDSKADILDLYVTAGSELRNENNNTCYIFIQTHGNINLVRTEKMTEETSKIEVSKSLLTPGINQITIFDSKGVPRAERYIYTSAKTDNFIRIHASDTCGLRDKFMFEIEAGNQDAEEFNSANLSVSVSPVNNDAKPSDISNYLIYGSEYGLRVPGSIKGMNSREITSELMDSLLVNVRSNWIDWPVILSDNLPILKYQAEKEYHYLSGKLAAGDQKPLQSSEYVILCSPGKEAGFQYARTDSAGNFNFKIPIDEVVKDLIIMPDNADNKHKILIESSFADKYPEPEVYGKSSSLALSPLISKMSINHQVQTIFGTGGSGKPISSGEPPVLPLRFYGKPDIELVLADYISLPVMNEIFFELLPGVSMKQKKMKYEIILTEHIGDELVVSYPTLMIDGVKINDASIIANLDPETVEKIDVVKGKYLVGKYLFPGIINVITKAGDFTSVALPDYMIRMPYRVIDPVSPFVSPDYSSPEVRESRIPDYRNTLYWNPLVEPEKGKAVLELWSSDNMSDYLINIQGITSDGKPVSAKKVIRVR